ARFVFSPLEDLEDELIALFAVLPHQRLEVLDRRRLERLAPVALVDATDHADDVLSTPDVFGEVIAHPARGFGAAHSQRLVMQNVECRMQHVPPTSPSAF